MGSPQNPQARAKQKKRRRVKEARLLEKKIIAASTAGTPAEAKMPAPKAANA